MRDSKQEKIINTELYKKYYGLVRHIVAKLSKKHLIEYKLQDEIINTVFVKYYEMQDSIRTFKGYCKYLCMESIRECLDKQMEFKLLKKTQIKKFREKCQYIVSKENVDDEEAQYLVRLRETLDRRSVYKGVRFSSLGNKNNESSDGDGEIYEDSIIGYYHHTKDTAESKRISEQSRGNIFRYFVECVDRLVEKGLYTRIFYMRFIHRKKLREIEEITGMTRDTIRINVIGNRIPQLKKCIKRKVEDDFGKGHFEEVLYGL